MPSIETIYRETVKPLPVDEQRRLADLIRRNIALGPHSTGSKRSALEILESIQADRIFRTSSEADEYLKSERDSWDN